MTREFNLIDGGVVVNNPVSLLFRGDFAHMRPKKSAMDDLFALTSFLLPQLSIFLTMCLALEGFTAEDE